MKPPNTPATPGVVPELVPFVSALADLLVVDLLTTPPQVDHRSQAGRDRVVMNQPTAHGDRCVCAECFRVRMGSVPLNEALACARAAAQPIALNQVQRRHLAGFVKLWNADRVTRGLAPMLADDALTEGLSALENMMKEATHGRAQ